MLCWQGHSPSGNFFTHLMRCSARNKHPEHSKVYCCVLGQTFYQKSKKTRIQFCSLTRAPLHQTRLVKRLQMIRYHQLQKAFYYLTNNKFHIYRPATTYVVNFTLSEDPTETYYSQILFEQNNSEGLNGTSTTEKFMIRKLKARSVSYRICS